MTCTAQRHGATRHFYRRYRCRCPAAIAGNTTELRHDRLLRRRTSAEKLQARDRSNYVDEVNVQRACAGHLVVLGTYERWYSIDLLDARGLSASEVAERLGISSRTVTRRRAARRQEDVPVYQGSLETTTSSQ